jgi:hypothetical protein
MPALPLISPRLRRFLSLAHGFARAYFGKCRNAFMIAHSSNKQPMVETPEYLYPPLAARQWVLFSGSHPLRHQMLQSRNHMKADSLYAIYRF